MENNESENPETNDQNMNENNLQNTPNYQNDLKVDVNNTTDTENTTPTTTDVEEKKDEPMTPEWFMKDKFKTIDDQARSYKELSNKMGKYWGAPQDEYKVDGIEGIEANDPLIANLAPALKEMGISQDGFQNLVSKYMDANKAMMNEMEASLKKTLTETDVHTYQAINKWMYDSLTPEESMQIKNNWLMTTDDFKLFNNLRLMLAPNTSVPSNSMTPTKFETSKEVTNDKIKYKQELKAGARVQDRNYENELASRFRDAALREQRNKER